MPVIFAHMGVRDVTGIIYAIIVFSGKASVSENGLHRLFRDF